ncbi:MAG TPA: zinc-dependent metalloprotease [Saprospiraceae bacterium]|nr:zinc-dependent metalloprotease [Saprospiraceae bacterium]
MKIRGILFAFTFLLFTNVFLHAQITGYCGLTDPQPLMERIREHQKTLAVSPVHARSSEIKYVPITFILVADGNGNGRAREEQGLDQLKKLNADYAPQEILFYIDEWRYKDHTLVFTDPTHPTSVFQMRLVKDLNAMNLYVTQDCETGAIVGQTLGFYSPPNDWVVMRKDRFNGNLTNAILSHEAGHFFSLIHTFNGWDCTAYDEDVHGNPVNSIWSPCNGSLRVEFQNGSNCTIAGDLICDTNPDYNFGYGWSVGGDPCAEYTPVVMDPNGDVIDVTENNFMGYFLGCDDYFFSPDQQSIIEVDYLSADRAYLRTGYVPVQDPVDNNVVYNYPINGEETATFDKIDLDWEGVPGATDYLVVFDRSPSFTFAPQRQIVQESFLTIEELTPDVNYYWRVWPFNESQTGAGWGITQNFHTGLASGIETISSVNRIDVFPNPVKTDDEINVLLESERSFDAEITLYDMTGEVVWYHSSQRVEAGRETYVSIVVDRVVAGLYFLKIQSSEGGIISKKVSIL